MNDTKTFELRTEVSDAPTLATDQTLHEMWRSVAQHALPTIQF